MFIRSIALILLGIGLSFGAVGQDAPAAPKSQLAYLPVYSHIYHGSYDRKGNPGKVLLSAMVSIRNTDPRRPIRVTSARYFNTEGKLLREFVSASRIVSAFGTLELFVEKHDESGGSGANFIIGWEADAPVNPPVIEAIHAAIEGASSVLFATSATPIRAAD